MRWTGTNGGTAPGSLTTASPLERAYPRPTRCRPSTEGLFLRAVALRPVGALCRLDACVVALRPPGGCFPRTVALRPVGTCARHERHTLKNNAIHNAIYMFMHEYFYVCLIVWQKRIERFNILFVFFCISCFYFCIVSVNVLYSFLPV